LAPEAWEWSTRLPEARAASSLDHSSIGTIYGIEEAEEEYNVVCSRPCPQDVDDNGESIFIDP
jgi:hypothetical protein